MDNRLFPELSGADLDAALRSIADGIDTDTYTKKLTEEELADRKDTLTDLTISVSMLEDELKEHSKEIKDTIKPKKAKSKQLMKEIKAKSVVITGKLYKIIDEVNGQVGFYESTGELVNQRRLRPDERQLTIRSINKAI
ncbi:hypothetical protein D3C80_952770 [compost metagenome]